MEGNSLAKILLVDDDEDGRDTISYFLKTSGDEVILATDGKEGFDLTLKEKPDLIITDEAMPEITGPALLAMLRSKGIQTPVILIGGYVENRAEQLKQQGFSAVLEKPFLLATLKQAIDEILSS